MAFKDRVESYRQIIQHPANRTRKLDAALDYLRWNLGHRLLKSEYVFQMIEDAKIIVSARQNYATLVYVNGLWDFPEMVFLMHFLRPDDLFADIGSNVGGYTILASGIAGARSISFEPVPATFAELNRNLRLNQIVGLVEPHRCGLGAADAQVQMTANLGGMNHVATTRTRDATIEIDIRRLDDILAGRACSAMKIDAEGYETEVLAGGTQALADPGLHALVVEFNGSGLRYGHSDEEVHGIISQYGFSPARYDPECRQLEVLEGFDRNRMNTLYVRGTEHVLNRIQSARQLDYKGRML